MKIVLLGYMGSGKTTVGRLLAKKLGLPFQDFDDYIVDKLQATVPEIFEEKGELYFRKKEHQLLKEVLADPRDIVLSLGGGTPCYSGNMQTLLNNTPHIFYLMVPVGVLAERLKNQKALRPLILHVDDEDLPEFIGKHLFERTPFYSQATYTILAGERSAEQIAEEIQTLLV